MSTFLNQRENGVSCGGVQLPVLTLMSSFVMQVVVGSSLDSVFMVMEYADHDLKAVMENRMTQPFKTAEVRRIGHESC